MKYEKNKNIDIKSSTFKFKSGWTIQRHWEHWAHKTRHKDTPNKKNTTQKTTNKGNNKITELEQSYKGKVKTHKYINRQNQSTTGKL
jgi:hypothetical protein